MTFDKQVFISYAHIDNVPLTPNEQGWISRFHASLSAMLSMRLGRKAEIWRDVKLTGNDIFADEIIQQFPKTALLISVLTPRYVESEWCTREVKEFCKTAETTGGITVDNKSRVLKVIKIPVDSEGPLPEVMKLALGYPFFIFDEQQTPLELDPAYGEEFTQKYNLKMAKLAFDVAELIKKIDAQSPRAPVPGAAPAVEKPGVFVADTSVDRREDREAVISDLRLHGYPTLADVQLPTEEASFVGELAAMLGRCKLSVHIIGANYGMVPDGPSEKAVAVLENELAIEYVKIFGLKRIIWIPEGTKSSSRRQQDFIDLLLRDPQAQSGADLITGDLEELKAAIHAALKKLETPPPPPPVTESPGSGSKLVYIICDERDRKATIPLRKLLKSQGLDSAIPAFDGDAATVRQTNQDLLTSCDAAVIFYGAADEAWKRSVDADIRKSAGYRVGKPPLAPFTYLAEPSTGDKTDLIDLEEPRLINCLDGFSDAALVEFLTTVSGKAQA
jgi:hypothetical protein